MEACRRNVTTFVRRDSRLVAFGWLNAFGVHSAFAHFCVLRSDWFQTAELGAQMLERWMSFTKPDGSPLLQLILGTIPVENQRAIRFVNRIGFKTCGMIPKLVVDQLGRFRDAELLYFERE